MKVEPIRLTKKDHRCNAIRFLTKRYLDAVDWTGYLKEYRKACRFDSREHTALEEFWHGLVWQLRGLLVQLAGYDYVSYVETHAVTSDVPGIHIEEALVKYKFKKRGEADEP